MKKGIINQFLNVLVTIAVLVVNALATLLPLNGLDTGQISDRFEIYFVPAGYVFSIWGIIYLGLIAFTVYQALPQNRNAEWLRKITPFYILSGLANMTWLFLWHYEVFLVTWIAMLAILGSLLVVTSLIHRTTGTGTVYHWLVKAPFSLYLGWISVATVANLSQVLYYINWNGWGIQPQVWALIMLVVAALIAFLNIWIRRDNIYVLVFVWAYIGIAVKHSQTSVVMLPAVVLAGMLGLLVVLNITKLLRVPSSEN